MATVKTAISIDEKLFEQAQQAATEMNISRSSLFARALEEFLERYENRQLLEQLNAVYAEPPDEEERAFLQASLRHARRLAENDPW